MFDERKISKETRVVPRKSSHLPFYIFDVLSNTVHINVKMITVFVSFVLINEFGLPQWLTSVAFGSAPFAVPADDPISPER